MAIGTPRFLHGQFGGQISAVGLPAVGFIIATALLSFRPEDVKEVLIGAISPIALSFVFFRARDF